MAHKVDDNLSGVLHAGYPAAAQATMNSMGGVGDRSAADNRNQ